MNRWCVNKNELFVNDFHLINRLRFLYLFLQVLRSEREVFDWNIDVSISPSVHGVYLLTGGSTHVILSGSRKLYGLWKSIRSKVSSGVA